MTRAASPKLGAYVGLSALGLLAALVLELPELAALAAPFAVMAGLALAAERRPELGASLVLERDRVVEGDEVDAVLTVSSPSGIDALEVVLRLPAGIEVVEGENPTTLRLRPGESRNLELKLRAARWGAYQVGQIYARARDGLDAFRYETRIELRRPLRAYPRPERAEELLRPVDTQVHSGHHVSRERGEGIEFADLRPFAPGDRVRRVNWRASARRGELWVNEYHPERNADVVLFLDTFAEAGDARGTTLDLAVRAAAGLATGYLRQKDRVGFVAFGGRINWLQPRTGVQQLYRIIDWMLESEIVLHYAWRNVDVLPRQTLPPKALVIALTPLLDERSIAALLDLRARGFDLAVIEVSPLPFVPRGREPAAELAWRVWAIRREVVRRRFERAGVPVGVWDERSPFGRAVEEVRSFRRFAARVHA